MRYEVTIERIETMKESGLSTLITGVSFRLPVVGRSFIVLPTDDSSGIATSPVTEVEYVVQGLDFGQIKVKTFNSVYVVDYFDKEIED